MRWHVFRRHILNNWKRRRVRVTAAVLVFVVVICVQYSVSRLPQSQDVEKAKYTPAIAKASQQEIVVSNPVLSDGSDVLLKFDGKDEEIVEFRSASARLTSDTLSFLQKVGRGRLMPPPVELSEIDYLIKNDHDPTAGNRLAPNRSAPFQDSALSCLTFITVRAIDNQLPTEIHFYQPENGNQAFQSLTVSAVGADLEIQIRQSQPESKIPEGNPRAPGCKKTLFIGQDWSVDSNGEFDLSLIVPANGRFRFDFQTLSPTTSMQSHGGLFEPFVLGNSTLKAKTLSVIPYEANNLPLSKPRTPNLSVEGAGDTGTLNIVGLKETSDELQLSFAGVGKVKLNGNAAETWGLVDLINKYPITAVFFGLANAALAGWILHNIFGKQAS